MPPGDAKRARRPALETNIRSTLFAGESGSPIDPKRLEQATLAPGDLVLGTAALADPMEGDRYVPMGLLGEGGMGRVTVVFDRVLGRHVARKELLEDRMRGLLVAEAQVSAQLEHPAIVPVYDLETDAEGLPRYTMRVVRGRALNDILDDEERPPLAQLLGILRQVCLAIDYAHTRGVVHRDLKPHNIVVGAFGEVYVLDWGIAHVLPTSDLNRAAGLPELSIAGTPAYMAPEQLEGLIGPTVDVYALGAILFEILTGERPFPEATDIRSIRARRSVPPPSHASTERKVPVAFDDLTKRCLARSPEARPASARAIADAIDAFLDGERERAEREREASRSCEDGVGACGEHRRLAEEARTLDEESRKLLASMPAHEPFEKKRPAWDLADQARKKQAEATRALARAEIAFSSALGRVQDHAGARAGLARLHLDLFLEADAEGDHDRMAWHLHLARSYDDGSLERELADEGELSVHSEPPSAEVELYRYDPQGPLLVARDARHLGPTPAACPPLPSGSYLVLARYGARTVRYPLRLQRSRAHRLDIRFPGEGTIPEGMMLVAGGPYRALTGGRHEERSLPDFALGSFPVTMREYVAFLSSLDTADRVRRTPIDAGSGGPLVELCGDGWVVTEAGIASWARKYVPLERELEIPVFAVRWFDAIAYCQWLSTKTGLAFRLPTAHEWEKAMRGADGRSFPMGKELDPSFAKIRNSRPEGTQPEPVGAFPLDESPYGARDLAGGIADWTSTMVDGQPPPSLADEGSAVVEQRQAYYVGGHWGTVAFQPLVQAVLKQRNNAVGFRLALSLDRERSSDLIVEPLHR